MQIPFHGSSPAHGPIAIRVDAAPTARLAAPVAALLIALATACAPLFESVLPASSSVEAARSAPAGPAPKPEVTIEGITEYRLSNGLKVLLFPDRSVPTITVNVTYAVGSRNEGRGEGGMAHLLEHMLFKGTPTRGNIFDELQERGATFNGTTAPDRTNYFETLPASDENLDFALAMEADRMIHSSIAKEEFDKEMTVVRNEFEAGENDPNGILFQRIMATAYLFHGYGRPTIGNKSDIERVPVENLRRFYRKYYQPDNAMLVVAGNFDQEAALERVQRYFGVLPRPDRVLDQTYTEEPPQDGPRQVVLRRVGSVAAAAVAYHIPSGAHPDTPALEVLARVLGDEPSGRLYQALVASGKATSASAFAYTLQQRGLLTAFSEVRLDQDVDQVEQILIEQLENVAGTITEQDVERARNRILKRIRLSLTDSRRIALLLSEAESLGDWRLLFLQRDQMEKVTAAEVNRVAERYLLSSNRTAGVFRPTKTPARAQVPERPDVAALLDGYQGSASVVEGDSFEATARNIEASVMRGKAGRIDVALLPKKTRGELVQGVIRLRYGTEASLRDRAEAAAILPSLMLRGTVKRDYQSVRDALDAIETDLSLSGGPGSVVATLRTTRPNLPKAIELLAEILRTPSLPKDELERLREEELADLEASLTDPQRRLFRELLHSVLAYSKDSLFYVPTIEESIERLRGVTRAEIVELHAGFLGADHAQASFVGDFDPERVRTLLADALGDWTSPAPFERIEAPHVPNAPVDAVIDTPDKKMAAIARGAAFQMRSGAPDYPAISIANYILGQSPSSRLITELRQERGLSYGAGSFVRVPDESDASYLVAYAIAAPENARTAQDVLQEQFRVLLENPIPGEELAQARTGYQESFKTQLASDRYIASQLAEDLYLGRPFTFHQEVVDAAVRADAGEIQAVLRKYLADAEYVDLAAGDQSKFTP